MQMLYVTKLYKTYVNESYIASTRSYVVSMPVLFFFVLKMLCVRQSNGTYLKAMQFLKVRIKEEMHGIVST